MHTYEFLYCRYFTTAQRDIQLFSDNYSVNIYLIIEINLRKSNIRDKK